jgi:gamma-glutamyltranspeptidase
MPYNKILHRELLNLIETEKKVDHPDENADGTKGSKDIADSVANVVVNLLKEEYNPLQSVDFSKLMNNNETIMDKWKHIEEI